MAPNFGYRIGDLTEETTAASNDEMEWSLAGKLGSVKIKFKNLVLAIFAAFFGISFVSVKSYGAVGDGVTDDTTAIQSAINAAPSGSIVAFPSGVFSISAPINPGTKAITIRGAGWHTSAATTFGDNAQWLAANAIQGTVIRATGTTDGIVTSNTFSTRLVLEDLAVVGPGSGTSVGLNLGTGVANNRIETHNVGVFNFSVGVRFNNNVDHTHYTLHPIGCRTGFLFDGAGSINNMRFFDCKAEVCTIGIDFQGGAGINWVGGLCQSNTTGIRFKPTTIGGLGQISISDGLWFEANTVPWLIDTTSGPVQDITFNNCRDSSAGTVGITIVQAISRLTFNECNFGGETVTIGAGATGVASNNTKFGAWDFTGASCVNVISEGVNAINLASGIDPSTTTPGAAYTPDWRLGPVHRLTLNANITISAPTHAPSDGTTITFLIRQDGTGGRTVSWGAGYHASWSDTGNTASKYSTISFRQIPGGQWIQIGAQAPYLN